MPAKIYYDNDADLSLLKDKTIAILGYGSQGHAQAQNLRDSGCNVIVGQRPGSTNYDLASKPRLQAGVRRRGHQAGRPGQHPAARRSAGRHLSQTDIRAEPEAGQHADVLARLQRPLRPGRSRRKGVDTRAGRAQGPRPPGAQRIRKRRRRALPDRPERRRQRRRLASSAWPMPRASAARRAGVIETTFAEETETDLFGEQVVLCGGVSALVKAGFETLVEAGYQPEMAYFECMHELKLIVDLFYQGGLNYMRYSVSNTAEFGDYTRGPRIVTDETKAEMKRILKEIQNGKFAKEWIGEAKRAARASRPCRKRQAARRRSRRPQAPQTDDVDQREGSRLISRRTIKK